MSSDESIPQRRSRTTTVIEIHGPIDDLFEILTNADYTERWFPGNVREWWTTPPPTRIGSTRHAEARLLRVREENEGEVVAYKPPSGATLRVRASNMRYDVTVSLASQGGITRVTVDSELVLTGVRRFAAPIVVSVYRTSWRRGLANLKRLVEAGELVPTRPFRSVGTSDGPAG